MPEFPSGTVTFLFTDVEGSTRRWEDDSLAMLRAVERHFVLLDEAIATNNGVRFKTIGDAIQAAFPTAPDALRAAVAAQRALATEDWGGIDPIAVRMALHAGAAEPRDGDYLAPALNRLARLLATAAGGQTVLTEAVRNLVRDHVPPDVQLRDLGVHRLRDLKEAEHVFQVDIEGLPSRFPPLQTLDRPIHNLPAQTTAFVGREREIEEIKARLSDENVRLLTLTGPGGTGKTRLAIRIAADLASHYPDGAWFIQLAPVRSPERVATAIAESLGVRESPGEPIIESLHSFLRPRRLLLVLDNFEHVVEAAPAIADLLATAPGLQVLATSRTPLRVSGEHESPVHPLSVPTRESGLQLDEALGSEAVRLFADRARAVRPDFQISDANVKTVAAIARRLDGLPLAIELAAARMRLLPPEAILTRLDSRLALLTGGGRDRPERQQTLRAAIAWSHDLLDASERALFRRLGVFAGSWTIEAAEAIVQAVPEPALAVVDCLDALHDNSLIRRADDEREERSAEPRFAMLQTIREFALEQLAASGELEILSAAHATYYSALAEYAAAGLTGPEAATSLDLLESDHDNMRATLAWWHAEGDARQAVTLANALWRFWWLRGHIGEGREELEAALALPIDEVVDHAATRAAALDAAGVLAETQGDYDHARSRHESALALARANDDRRGITRALGNLGVVAFDRGELEESASLLDQSLTLARKTGDDHLIATALNDLGRVAFAQQEFGRAEGLYQESLTLRRKSGNPSDIARALNNLGGVAYALSDYARMSTLFGESLDLYRNIDDPWGAAGALNGLALAATSQGETETAIALLAESVDLFQDTGDARNAGLALIGLAEVEKLSGDLRTSAMHYREAIEEFQAVSELPGVIEGLLGLAGVAARLGNPELAARLQGAATASLTEASAKALLTTDSYREDAEAIQMALGEEQFAAAWKAGRLLSIENSIALAGAVTVPLA